MLELNDDNFDKEVKEYKGVILIDFWAPWCGPCQMLGPIIEELAKEFEGKVKVCKANVDENPKVASEHGIMSIPALKVFKDGELAEELVGLQTKEKLTEVLNSALGK